MARISRPAALKELDGNPGKRARKAGPTPSGAPVCPKHLEGYAREVWFSVTQSMPEALYTTCDVAVLSAYCVAADMHRKSVIELRATGEVITTETGAAYQNPWVSILNRQAVTIATLGARLGLDPVSRSNIAMPPEKPKSKFEGLIGIAGGRKP